MAQAANKAVRNMTNKQLLARIYFCEGKVNEYLTKTDNWKKWSYWMYQLEIAQKEQQKRGE